MRIGTWYGILVGDTLVHFKQVTVPLLDHIAPQAD